MEDAEPAQTAQERAAMGEDAADANGKLSSGEAESPKAVNGKAEDAPTEEATRDEVNVDSQEEASDPAEIDDDPEEETTKFVEWDPTGRFGRTTELLGRGTYKNVYKAFDEEEGMDVAWNQVKVHGLPAAEKARLLSEVEILKRLDHKNVLKFYHSWNTIDEKTGEVSVNFITEACAGTLNKYAARFKNNLDMRAVKSWSRQILRGLAYLHAHEPPIVHRDLKCDNIFVNGNAGEIKIGDLGLAAMLDHQRTHSVIGTPEFMAPELYEEDYDERVDIYSFGMCLIELVTFECPYCECKNPAQIYKRVSSGVPPASLEKIKEKGDDIYEFISLAIAPADQRPTAQQLLDHKWLMKKEKKTMVPRRVVEEEPEVPRPIVREDEELQTELPLAADSGRKIVRVYSEADTTEPPSHKRGASLDVRVKGTFLEDNSLRLRLRIADSSGQNRTVEFPFNTGTDSARSVATEMVEALSLESSAVEAIEREIEKEVKYLEDEKRGFCVRDESKRPSADNSGASSPEAARTQDAVSSQDGPAVAANVGHSDFVMRTPSTESLSDKARILLDDNTIVPQSQPMVARDEHTSRPKSAFEALKQHDAMSLLQSAAGSGGSSPGETSPSAHPAPPQSAPVAPADVAASLEQFAAAAKPPRVPATTAVPQPHMSEHVMQEVHRVFEQPDLGDRSSDGGSSYMNEEEEEEMEELRLLEELELQQQQEEAEMRQRHTTERQQKLRSLQKKRIERTASKMALLAASDTGSESARVERHSRGPTPAPTQTHPTTRLSNAQSASSLHHGLPPQPPPSAAPAPAPAPTPNTTPTAPQHQSAMSTPTSPPPAHVPEPTTTGAVQQPHAPHVSEYSVASSHALHLQTDTATLSRTASQRSMRSDSDVKGDEAHLPPEEQAKLAKEKKRIEALAKMQMMEESSLLSLDSKSTFSKGSKMSLSSQAKKDSADDLHQSQHQTDAY